MCPICSLFTCCCYPLATLVRMKCSSYVVRRVEWSLRFKRGINAGEMAAVHAAADSILQTAYLLGMLAVRPMIAKISSPCTRRVYFCYACVCFGHTRITDERVNRNKMTRIDRRSGQDPCNKQRVDRRPDHTRYFSLFLFCSTDL